MEQCHTTEAVLDRIHQVNYRDDADLAAPLPDSAKAEAKPLSEHLARDIGSIALRASERNGDRSSSDMLESLSLLHRAQDGDRDAFAGLYQRYVGDVTRYLGIRTPRWHRDAVPDLVQDTFCEALADLPNAEGDVQGWLIVHAAKAHTRYDRSWRRYTRAAFEQHRHNQSNPEPRDEVQLPRLHRNDVVQALASLPIDQRRCMQLRFLESQSIAATAELMGRTPNAVNLLQRRALRRLRTRLAAAPAAVK